MNTRDLRDGPRGAASPVTARAAARRTRWGLLPVAVSLACGGGDAGGGAPPPLAGTAWRLEEIAGTAVVGDAAPTLRFEGRGRVSGSGSCNRFSAPADVGDGTIDLGPLVATRMGCGEAVNRQETGYFAALEAADRFELDGESLVLRGGEGTGPLRFRRTEGGTGATRPEDESRGDGGVFPPEPATASDRLTGVWTVTGHWLTDVSAMDEESATGWHGRTIQLLRWEARAPAARCAEPSYRAERVAADAFVSRFESWPRDLVLPVEQGSVLVMSVRCDGEEWAAPGGTMIRVEDDRALTLWEGVFFALDRDREAERVDFRAQGNEPGWRLQIIEGERMRFEYDYGAEEAITPAPEPDAEPDSGTVRFHAVTEASDLLVEIRPEPCLDDMSGFPFPATVEITLGERVFLGCGGPRPDPGG